MKQTFLLLLTVWVLEASALETIKLSLNEAINSALNENYGQQIREVTRQSASEDVAQAKRDLSPDLSATASHGVTNKNNNGSYSINASVMLWNGGQNINAIRKSKVLMEQADSQLAQAQNNLAISVIQTYLTVLMNDELYNYQTEVARISELQQKQGEIKYHAGQILKSDYLLLKAQSATDNYALTNSHAGRENAKLELKKLLSFDSSLSIEMVVPEELSAESLTLPTLQELIDQTLAWLPDLQITSQNIQLAQLDTKIAKAAWSPTLALTGSIGTNYNSSYNEKWKQQLGDNNLNQVGVTLSIPLWNKGKTKSSVKQSTYRQLQAELQAKETELNLLYTLEKEYLNTQSLREKYEAARIGSNAYEETFKVFSTQFEAGSVTTTELLQQQNNYLTALNNYIQSKYDFLLNRKVLDVYMGIIINM